MLAVNGGVAETSYDSNDCRLSSNKKMIMKKATSGCNPCGKCKVWKKLTTDPRYRVSATSKSIGGEREIIFAYLPRVREVVIILPCRPGKCRSGKPPVDGYPHRFTETQFKVMCCRFSYVTRNGPCMPSHFVGNNGEFNKSASNSPGWTPPSRVFDDPRKDPPFIVAVVRKVLEDSRQLNKKKYCSCQNNCK